MVWRANYSSIYNYRLVFEVHLNIDRIFIETLKGLKTLVLIPHSH